jgi:NAD+-dependent protein deacetylase sirtuin 4
MSRFVPKTRFDLNLLPRLRAMLQGRRVAVLTGAGCSTASGIPDYRGPVTGKKERTPIMYQEFVTSAEARRRYWARSALGWPRLRAARPNPAHFALAELEEGGLLTGLITQNVDGLHKAAGSQQLVELHGALARVRCLDCGARTCRDAVQEWLLTHNPGWRSACDSAEVAPDGDMEIPEIPDTFRVPTCSACPGSLKPDVVFFGENVAKDVVDRAWRVVDEADVLLVVGSSLTVYSGFRFVVRAKERDIPVALVNVGPTRADDVADLKIEAPCCEVLTRLG